jgi:hypothetical protein
VSSDNGIYIGRFLSSSPPLKSNEDGYEYRVIHAQAIENCDIETYGYLKDLKDQRKMCDANLVLYYGKSKVFTDVTKAWKEARRIANEYIYTEYGCVEFHYDVLFPSYTRGEAEEIVWKGSGESFGYDSFDKSREEYLNRYESEIEEERSKQDLPPGRKESFTESLSVAVEDECVVSDKEKIIALSRRIKALEENVLMLYRIQNNLFSMISKTQDEIERLFIKIKLSSKKLSSSLDV